MRSCVHWLACCACLAAGVCVAGESPGPQDPAFYYRSGLAHLRSRDFVRAVLDFRSAQKLGLNTAALHKALGLAYYGVHQFTLFLKETDRAIEMDPADPEAYHNLGRYYESEFNDWEKALPLFEKALERNPEDFMSLHFKAHCLQRMGRPQEAMAGYETAIRVAEARGQRFSWPYQKMAELMVLRDPAAALRYARTAVELEPAIESNHLMLSKVHERMQDWEAALKEVQEAARLKPNDPSIRYLLFQLYKKLGNAEAAAAELRMHKKLRAIYGSGQ